MALSVASTIPFESWTETFASAMAERCPGQCADLLARQPEITNINSACANFARARAVADPEAAAEWALSLPGDRANAAARGTAESWARYDETAASSWVAGLPEGTPLRELAAAGLASGLASSDPQAAWQWAATLSDRSLTFGVFADVARGWGREAPPGFHAAYNSVLDGLQMTPEEKRAALSVLNEPPRN